MSNKNIKKVLAVALLSTIGLAACGKEVQAKTTHYDDPIVSFTDNESVYHNIISIIEDAYRDGSLASAVLDEVLYQYSVSVFGRYNRIAEPYNLGGEEITLKEAAAQVDEDGKPKAKHDKVDAFIESHKAYWTTDNDGNRVPAEERGNTEYARVRAKWTTIEDRIARDFYGDIEGGAYSTRGYFSEKKYLANLKSSLKHVLDYDASRVTEEKDKVVITPDVKEEDVFKPFIDIDGQEKQYLHRENYQDPAAYTLDDPATEDINISKARYVEEELIPTIYRTLLVEQYLLDESYNTLGRSYARKVNVITIANNSNNDKAANYLMKYFVRNVISGGKLPDQNPEGSPYYVDYAKFTAVQNAYKGLVNNDQKNPYLELVNEAFPDAFPYESFTGFDGGTYKYYVGTDFGDMMADFRKITNDINTTDTSVESDFTGSFAYTADIGKQIKENDIRAKSYTTDGWYIKNGGLSDLPEVIKSRLFNIGVANVLDDPTVTDRFATATYTVPEKESKLVAKINGKHYLKVASQEAGAEPTDDILFYEDGKYYVVQIEEAVSGSKLAKEQKEATYSEERREEIINEVARIIGANDTYRTLSTKHWLEQAALEFHDQKVYDYFKDNYPDLFEDD